MGQEWVVNGLSGPANGLGGPVNRLRQAYTKAA